MLPQKICETQSSGKSTDDAPSVGRTGSYEHQMCKESGAGSVVWRVKVPHVDFALLHNKRTSDVLSTADPYLLFSEYNSMGIGRMVVAVVGNFYPRNSSVHAAIMIESRDEENFVLDTRNVQGR